MFWHIFTFEIRYKLRQAGVYLYFLIFFVFAFLYFAFGIQRVFEKQFLNSPAVIAITFAGMSMFMIVTCLAIMGLALFRDIECNTKEYIFSYPITKAEYFFGRFFGSFSIVVLIGISVPLGTYLGLLAGPWASNQDLTRYGDYELLHYIHPFLIFFLANIFFTSALIFALVAITRNVRVIYGSCIALLLMYAVANFYSQKAGGSVIMHLTDPFSIQSLRFETAMYAIDRLNSSLVSIDGMLLVNRILWSCLGIGILLLSYLKFDFCQFLDDKRRELKVFNNSGWVDQNHLPAFTQNFNFTCNLKNIAWLTKIEILNVIRDNFFWIISISSIGFLYLIYLDGPKNYGVPDLPQTSMLLHIALSSGLLFFIFFILIFYAGEIVSREKNYGFAPIYDALPPPNWVFWSAKILSLILLAISIALIPIITAITVQIMQGFYRFDFQLYYAAFGFVLLPVLLEIIALAFFIHVLVNNKFAGHSVGIVIWVSIYGLKYSGYLDNDLLLYSVTSVPVISEFNGLNSSQEQLFWLHLGWLCFGALLLTLSYLLFVRGISSSFKERLVESQNRLGTTLKLTTSILLLGFLSTCSYNYYHLDYLNNPKSKDEQESMRAMFEIILKRYDSIPVPTLVNLNAKVELSPEKREVTAEAFLTFINKSNQPIESLLLDGSQLTQYSLKMKGKPMPFTTTAYIRDVKTGALKIGRDTSQYRIYEFDQPLDPSDTLIVEVNSLIRHRRFENNSFSEDIVDNGTALSTYLPFFGYNSTNELEGNDIRKKYGLPPKDRSMSRTESVSLGTALTRGVSLFTMDITIGTDIDQIAVAAGHLVDEWIENGRRYFRYVNSKPGAYRLPDILSARYLKYSDCVEVENSKKIDIEIYYHKSHGENLSRFKAAYKEGLQYFANVYGQYPFENIRLVEASRYGKSMVSVSGTNSMAEYFGWSANFAGNGYFDYCHYESAKQIALQWWGNAVTPSGEPGSSIVSDGLAKYSALSLTEKKFGGKIAKKIADDELRRYLWSRYIRRKKDVSVRADSELLYSKQSYEWDSKAGLVLLGLRDLIGEDVLNSALREFNRVYAFRNSPPYAGSGDLYRHIRKYVPDSLKYYLTDAWEKITFYNNKVLDAQAEYSGKNDEYFVQVKVHIAKIYVVDGVEHLTKSLQDYVGIRILGSRSQNEKEGTLHFQIRKFDQGEHSIELLVKGRPTSVTLDSYFNIIDYDPNDNSGNFRISGPDATNLPELDKVEAFKKMEPPLSRTNLGNDVMIQNVLTETINF